MRTYGEAVDVRPAERALPDGADIADGADGADGAALPDTAAVVETVEPGQFLWRGRLYVVRAVLAHWVELGPWWTAQGVGSSSRSRAGRPRGTAAPAGPDRASVDAWQGTRAAAARVAVGEPEPAPALSDEPRSVARDVGAVEREVWRVEARAGRASSVGVYDLVRDVPAPGSGRHARWRLARALD